MHPTKRSALARAGWRVGTAEEFLALSEVEAAIVQARLGLSTAVRERRRLRRLTQSQLAQALGSSQSRIAKLEAGDPSVSLDLLVRALLILGARPRELAKAFA